jgi:hypothetical protein
MRMFWANPVDAMLNAPVICRSKSLKPRIDRVRASGQLSFVANLG